MNLFLKLNYELRYVDTSTNNVIAQKVVGYIADNIRDMDWQISISDAIRKTDTNCTVLHIVLRLFDIKDIKEGKLKSYARYMKKENKLVVDQMLILNEYINYPEDQMRLKLCNDIFIYLKEMLLKYKNCFQDFDVITFIPLLEEQINKIRNCEFEDDFYESPTYKILKRVEERKKDNGEE